MAATATQRRDGRTFVNFSMPQRSQSMKSLASRPRAVDDKGEEELPYRPSKAQVVQSHITSDDLHATIRPSLGSGKGGLTAGPAIPERTTSLHRKTITWPATIEGYRPGSFNFDTVHTFVKTPWGLERTILGTRWSKSSAGSSALRPQVFMQLPSEIYQCIIDHLENVHTERIKVDVAGMQTDLRSLCLVSKTWHRIAADQLYRELWLPSNRAPTKRRWSKEHRPSRLQLLIGTLKVSPGLAMVTQKLHITAALAQELQSEISSGFDTGPTVGTLQALIRLCYNMEHISGYVIPAATQTIGLMDALAMRTHLKSHTWRLESKRSLPSLPEFIYSHDHWPKLSTLVISADIGVDLGGVAVSIVLSRLPCLKHLVLSGLHHDDYHDTTLMTLPSLRSLRLEKLEGLTDQGIGQLAYSRLAPYLESLTLVDLELASLQTIQSLLWHLTRMKRFTFVQETSPEPQVGIRSMNTPIRLGSSALHHLHWDCIDHGTALSCFAAAIQANHFPKLTTIKAPCDYDGTIQSLCRPIAHTKLTHDDVLFLAVRTKQRYTRDLRASQVQAQLRIRERSRRPSFNVIVQDERMKVCSTHVIGSILGNMDSKIEYDLNPGVEGGKTALVELHDVMLPKPASLGRTEQRRDVGVLF
ncbi:hypothetical protein DOTSEDRAFT_73749 [Dothistroma septosporum NZE10]|uniref:Uncharacterized protein n=1 Tax=Dothistroma septosporum (strain NZE10 / CBS 128990) TaxID=675120 RepID=N1PJC4_DOTSN|nr:hypothetical protein DOTSEDRAFT_73749 [Dothistroma septosporum NZE10]